MTDQLKISFDSLAKSGKPDCLPGIGVFGRKNSGKSSLINILGGKEMAGVSKFAGTTLEPAKYPACPAGLGHVILIDTSGIDDYGEAGEKRVQKSLDILKNIDIAVLLITDNLFAEPEKNLVNKFLEYSIPFIIVHNKSDLNELSPITRRQVETAYQTKLIQFNCISSPNLIDLVAVLNEFIPKSAFESKSIFGNMVAKNDLIILAIPDQINAPDDQLSRSQIEITRDLLENSCMTLFIKLRELAPMLEKISPKPKLIIVPTGSFKEAQKQLPGNMVLTTFGVVMAHYKGDFAKYLEDTPKLSSLRDGNKALILQAATDITLSEYKEIEEVRHLINDYCGKNLEYSIENVFNRTITNLHQFHFAIICGSYLLTKKQVAGILKPLTDLNIPVSSFDMVNAYTHGILEQATVLFKGFI